MPTYKTSKFGTNKADEIMRILPGIHFVITSDGELEINSPIPLTASELNKLKLIMGKDVKE